MLPSDTRRQPDLTSPLFVRLSSFALFEIIGVQNDDGLGRLDQSLIIDKCYQLYCRLFLFMEWQSGRSCRCVFIVWFRDYGGIQSSLPTSSTLEQEVLLAPRFQTRDSFSILNARWMLAGPSPVVQNQQRYNRSLSHPRSRLATTNTTSKGSSFVYMRIYCHVKAVV